MASLSSMREMTSVQEPLVDGQAEVAEVVATALGNHVVVGQPVLLELVEEERVSLVEVQPEALVQLGHDLRQALQSLWPSLSPLTGHRHYLTAIAPRFELALVGQLSLQVAQLDL